MATKGARVSALPVGIYRKYKNSTDFFKQWLLSAGITLGLTTRSSANDHALDVYARIVQKIASEPTLLTPAQLHLWPRALAACQTAITLRERASLFFPVQPHDSHAHFLTRLKEWLVELQHAERPVAEPVTTEEPLDFKNYYEVLALPDDYFDAEDEKAFAVPVSKTSKSEMTAAQRKKLFDKAFTEDLNAELACLIMELEELCEGVYEAYWDVKYRQSTLLEATAVAKVAIECAAHVIAKLQLKYPAIRSVLDLIHLLEDRIPKEAREKLAAVVLANWRNRGPRYQYVPGTMLIDLLWIGQGLHGWGKTAIPTNAKGAVKKPSHGDMYNEETTPEYTDPDLSAPPKFLSQHLAVLYDNYLDSHSLETPGQMFSMWFLAHFRSFFRTRVPSIQVTFVCACWIRSVAALQGDRWLRRTISIATQHRWHLQDRLKASILKGVVQRAHPELYQSLLHAFEHMIICDNSDALACASPIFTGCLQFEILFLYTLLGTNNILVKTQFRAFCHIYNALHDRRLIETIPFFEDALRVYEPAVFTPSRGSASQGSFYRSWMVSSHLTDGAIDAYFLQVRGPIPKSLETRVRPQFRIRDLTRMYRLLAEKDMKVLPEGARVSWRAMLTAVRALCHEELFETRVLSRDLLRLSDHLDDLFEEMCDALGRRAEAERIASTPDPDRSRLNVLNGAVEEAVAAPLLPLIGCLNLDGTTRPGPDFDFCLLIPDVRQLGPVFDGPVILRHVKKAVDLISKMFLERSCDEIDADYHTLPRVPDWVQIEFNRVFGDRVALEARGPSEVFASLMDMLTTSEGPSSKMGLTDSRTRLSSFQNCWE